MADPEQGHVLLCDLDEIVLCHIVALLRDPVPLSQTCKALRHASQNALCRQLWFQRWHTDPQVTQRHISWAVLSWRGLAGSSAQQIVRFLVHTMQASTETEQQMYQAQLQIAAEFIRSGKWVQLLRLVAPYADQLLNSAVAASHPRLLPALLHDWRGSDSGLQNKRTAASSICSAAEQSQQAALQHRAGNSNERTGSSTEALQQAELEQQLGEASINDHPPMLRYAVHLPRSLRLPSYKLNLLQSALIAATSAGQLGSVHLLLQEVNCIYAEKRPSKLDLLLSAAESAVAAAHHACLDSLLESITAAGTGRLEQLIDRQPAYSSERAQDACLHHVLRSSRYLIVAAARSGDCDMVDRVLDQLLQFCQVVRQQLPAALMAAGRRGHVAALQRLLAVHLMSSRPLQLAAADAASRGWPKATLAALLQHMAAKHRYELLQLLSKPIIIALQCNNITAADVMLTVLQAEAEMDQPESLRDVLLLLANKGQAEHVSWVLKVAPTVLVKLGQTAVAAALEGGYPHIAQLILDAGAERPAAYKAAAKRGELVAAVRSGNIAAVQELLTEVSLPLTWTCESGGSPSSGGSSSIAATTAAAGEAAAAGGTASSSSSSSVIQCLLSLLKCAADHPAPTSGQLLELLLPVAMLGDRILERHAAVAQLAEHCLQTGARAAFDAVMRSTGRTVRMQARILRDLIPKFQLPDDDLYLTASASTAVATCKAGSSNGNNSAVASSSTSRSSRGGAGAAAAVPGPVASALLAMSKPGCSDILSRYVANPYLATAHPAEYLGTAVRPSLPAVFMPCLKGLALLFTELSKLEHLPAGARVKDVALYKLMVRSVLQSCDRDLLFAFLAFMDKHGEAMLMDLPPELEDVGLEQDWEDDDW